MEALVLLETLSPCSMGCEVKPHALLFGKPFQLEWVLTWHSQSFGSLESSFFSDVCMSMSGVLQNF